MDNNEDGSPKRPIELMGNSPRKRGKEKENTPIEDMKASDFFFLQDFSALAGNDTMLEFPIFGVKQKYVQKVAEDLPFSGSLISTKEHEEPTNRGLDGKIPDDIASSTKDIASSTKDAVLIQGVARQQKATVVSYKGFKSLDEGTYLNDEVINFWMRW